MLFFVGPLPSISFHESLCRMKDRMSGALGYIAGGKQPATGQEDGGAAANPPASSNTDPAAEAKEDLSPGKYHHHSPIFDIFQCRDVYYFHNEFFADLIFLCFF